MTSRDPVDRLRDFIDKRWAVVQPKFYPGVERPSVNLDEVAPHEAEWFLASVASDGSEPPLFKIEDDRKLRSDRYPPVSGGAPRGSLFFEEYGRLRLETIVHMAAMARLRGEFG